MLKFVPDDRFGNTYYVQYYGNTLAADGSTTLIVEEGVYAINAMAVSAEEGSVSGAGAYDGGESVTLSAIPAKGYRFKQWTLNGEKVSDQAEYEFEADGDKCYFAEFEEEESFRGDCDGDGEINRADRIYLARALAGWEGYDVPGKDVADFNDDGEVDRQDRMYLARSLAGWEGYIY